MRYGIISDIHSNIEALNVALSNLTEKQVDIIVALGDIVGYGPDPEECVNIIMSKSIVSVMGNHDFGLNSLDYENYFNTYARDAIRWTRNRVSEQAKSFIKELPLFVEKEHFTMFHGSLSERNPFRYIISQGDAIDSFDNLKTPIGFFGHSHIPGVFSMGKDKKIEYTRGAPHERIDLKDDYRYLINVGSVGQPRDGIPLGSFVIFDSELLNVEFVRFKYDIEKVYNKIIGRGLPPFLGERLFMGF